MSDSDLTAAATALRGGRIVVLAGAGLLAAAGLLPPERRGGLWDQYDAVKCATPEGLSRHPELAWTAFAAWLRQVREAADRPAGPSPAHRALAQLHRAGKLRGVVTSTTDGLVRMSGVDRVAELFGAIDRVRCTECRQRQNAPSRFEGPPACAECGAETRPDLCLFGEEMPRAPRELSAGWVYGGGGLLVLGADLTRPPIHRIPEEMMQEGGRTIALGGVEVAAVRRVRGIHIPGDLNHLLPDLASRLT
jgi:NAD-dependent deacetylase